MMRKGGAQKMLNEYIVNGNEYNALNVNEDIS